MGFLGEDDKCPVNAPVWASAAPGAETAEHCFALASSICHWLLGERFLLGQGRLSAPSAKEEQGAKQSFGLPGGEGCSLNICASLTSSRGLGNEMGGKGLMTRHIPPQSPA